MQLSFGEQTRISASGLRLILGISLNLIK